MGPYLVGGMVSVKSNMKHIAWLIIPRPMATAMVDCFVRLAIYMCLASSKGAANRHMRSRDAQQNGSLPCCRWGELLAQTFKQEFFFGHLWSTQISLWALVVQTEFTRGLRP
jgi:hypothetical protein